MAHIGNAARHLRISLGLTQRAAAQALQISNVHLCNIEANKAVPSEAILNRYREMWNVDLHVLAWCLYGDMQRLPPGVREAGSRLANAWRAELGAIAGSSGGPR